MKIILKVDFSNEEVEEILKKQALSKMDFGTPFTSTDSTVHVSPYSGATVTLELDIEKPVPPAPVSVNNSIEDDIPF